MLIIYALCLTPFLMVGIMCVAIVRLVREGRYRKNLIGAPPTDAPPPATAVALVMSPIAVVILAAVQSELGWASTAALTGGASVLGFFVYSAAARRYKRHRNVE
jgi:hypothetical protein